MKLSQLMYLDTAFIVDVYETVTNTQVPVSVSKSVDVSASLSAFFVTGGATTTETKEFPISSHRMFDEIRKSLDEYPTIEFNKIEYSQLPEYFWMRGVFGACGSDTMQGGHVVHRESYFRLYSDLSEQRKSLILVTNDVYLSTGYDQIQKHLAGSCQGFAISVLGLFKTLAFDIVDAPICAPLVMIKEGNA